MLQFCSQKNKKNKQTENRKQPPTAEDRDKQLEINKTQLEWVY